MLMYAYIDIIYMYMYMYIYIKDSWPGISSCWGPAPLKKMKKCDGRVSGREGRDAIISIYI